MDYLPEDLPSIDALHNLALVEFDQSLYSQAELRNRQAMIAYERLLGPDNVSTLVAKENLGSVLRMLKRNDEAAVMLEAARTGYITLYGEKHESVHRADYRLGNVYSDQNKIELSKEMYERASIGLSDTIGPDADLTLSACFMLGARLRDLKRYQEALQILEPTLSRREKVFGWEDKSTVSVALELGRLYTQLNQYTKAQKLLLKVIAAREKSLGPNHQDTLLAVENLAWSYQREGRLDMALIQYENLVRGREQALGPENLQTVSAYYVLGLNQMKAGKPAMAEQMFLRVFNARKQILGFKDPETLHALNSLSTAYRAQRKFKDAERVLHQILSSSKLPDDSQELPTDDGSKQQIEISAARYELGSSGHQKAFIELENNSQTQADVPKGHDGKPIGVSQVRYTELDDASRGKSPPFSELDGSGKVETSNKKVIKKWARTLLPTRSASKHQAAIREVPGSETKPSVVSETKQSAGKEAAPAARVSVAKPVEEPTQQPVLPDELSQKLKKAGFKASIPECLKSQYPAFWACAKGRVDLLEIIIRHKPNPWYLDNQFSGYPGLEEPSWKWKKALRVALENGHLDAAKFLLDHGVKPHYGIRDVGKITATCGSDPELMETIMRGTFTMPAEEATKSFHTALSKRDFENAKALLKYGAPHGYDTRDKDKIVSECGGNIELLDTILQQLLPIDDVSPDAARVNLDHRIWVFLSALKKRDISVAQFLWEHAGCREYVSNSKAQTNSDALYWLHQKLSIFKRDRSAVLEYLRSSGAMKEVQAMWLRSKDDIKIISTAETSVRNRGLGFQKEHNGMLDPAVRRWD